MKSRSELFKGAIKFAKDAIEKDRHERDSLLAKTFEANANAIAKMEDQKIERWSRLLEKLENFEHRPDDRSSDVRDGSLVYLKISAPRTAKPQEEYWFVFPDLGIDARFKLGDAEIRFTTGFVYNMMTITGLRENEILQVPGDGRAFDGCEVTISKIL
jgi:hypothetical protein